MAVTIAGYTQPPSLFPLDSSLNFGNVDVGNRDSILVHLSNNGPCTQKITAIKFYSIYDKFPFFSKQDTLSITKNASDSIWIYFEPVQNILHNSEMIVSTSNTCYGRQSNVVAIDLQGQGKFPLSYYDTTENLVEEDLKKALKYRLGLGYKQLSYNEARDEMYHKIDNQNSTLPGKVEGVYTGTIKTYTNRSNVQSTVPQFNTEHTFPQGFFNSVLPERSDIHHLFPTVGKANSERSNKPFGNVNGGTASGGGSFFNSTTYEPRDKQKGRTARAMMYFVLRYSDYSNHFSFQENTLKKWHDDFPVDSIEEERNEGIFAVQKNRNPFIDYPQLEKRISRFVSNSTAPINWGLDVLESSIDFGVVVSPRADTFNYVMVNNGNQAIDFNNFELSDSSILSFNHGSGIDTTISPGDNILISIRLQTINAGSVGENLTFKTNMPGSRSSFIIPIRANSVVVSLDENRLNESPEVFPNPFNDHINIHLSHQQKVEIEMVDITGRAVSIIMQDDGKNQVKISTSELLRGIYLLRISSGNRRFTKRIIKY